MAARNAAGIGPYSAPVEACYSGAAAHVDAAHVEGPTKRAADAGYWEPREPRGSHTVLREPGGATPGYVIQAYDYDTATWFTAFVAPPDVATRCSSTYPAAGAPPSGSRPRTRQARVRCLGPVEVCWLP